MADDHAIFRDGLRKTSRWRRKKWSSRRSPKRHRVHQAARKTQAGYSPLDLRMPDKDGLAVLEEVNFDQLPTRVIVLTLLKTTATLSAPCALARAVWC